MKKRRRTRFLRVVIVGVALLAVLSVASIVYTMSTVDLISDDFFMSQGKTHRNEQLGVEFRYPSSWILEEYDSPTFSPYIDYVRYLTVSSPDRKMRSIYAGDWPTEVVAKGALITMSGIDETTEYFKKSARNGKAILFPPLWEETAIDGHAALRSKADVIIDDYRDATFPAIRSFKIELDSYPEVTREEQEMFARIRDQILSTLRFLR